MGYKLLRYPLGEKADLGFMIKKDNDIVIFTNSCSRLSREIFTLAHEIGQTEGARIMSEFSVSFDMALNRLESLKVIGTDLKLRLDNAKTEI